MSELLTTLLPPRRDLPPLSALFYRMAQTVLTWEERRRTRRSLGRVSPHILKDIGIDAFAAEREAKRPFWKP